MKIKWLGHACFLISSQNGTRILTDPFDSSVGYSVPSEEADIVTISHGHHDHNYVDAVKGEYVQFDSQGSYNNKDIAITGVSSFHDSSGGTKRGSNIIFILDVDGLRVCHCGDLGHELNEDQVEAIGKVDVLLLPVGGNYTIDAKQAANVANQLKPKVIIPMHYKTEAVNIPIEGVDKFLGIMGDYSEVESNQVEITTENINELANVLILDYE